MPSWSLSRGLCAAARPPHTAHENKSWGGKASPNPTLAQLLYMSYALPMDEDAAPLLRPRIDRIPISHPQANTLHSTSNLRPQPATDIRRYPYRDQRAEQQS